MKEFEPVGKPRIKRALIVQKQHPGAVRMGWHCSDHIAAGDGISPGEAYLAWFSARSRKLYPRAYLPISAKKVPFIGWG